MTKLSRAVRNRLNKLATYLEGLPEDYSHFSMFDYLQGNDNAAEARYARENGGVHTCGTAACAVGHGPAAGILFPARMVTKSIYNPSKFEVDWGNYSLLFTGEDDADTPLWLWLFASQWRNADDHHFGAAARIRYILDGRSVPAGFSRWRGQDYEPLYRQYDKRHALTGDDQ